MGSEEGLPLNYNVSLSISDGGKDLVVTHRVKLSEAIHNLYEKRIFGEETLTIRITDQSDQECAPQAGPPRIGLHIIST
jgi:hypothetical protein